MALSDTRADSGGSRGSEFRGLEPHGMGSAVGEGPDLSNELVHVRLAEGAEPERLAEANGDHDVVQPPVIDAHPVSSEGQVDF